MPQVTDAKTTPTSTATPAPPTTKAAQYVTQDLTQARKFLLSSMIDNDDDDDDLVLYDLQHYLSNIIETIILKYLFKPSIRTTRDADPDKTPQDAASDQSLPCLTPIQYKAFRHINIRACCYYSLQFPLRKHA